MKIFEFQESNIPLIVVDVQPEYSNGIVFTRELMKSINSHRGGTLMLINAEETGVSSDTKDDCLEYWYDHGLSRRKKLVVYDKGYGDLRNWIDLGASEETIIHVLRTMYDRNVYDSRDLDDLKEIVGEDWEDWMNGDMIILNLHLMEFLKKFPGAYLCGGGRDECLAEVRILMDAFDIPYKLLDEFIYG